MRFRVEKLIRDGLPQMMRDQGLTVFCRRLDDQAYINALKAKRDQRGGFEGRVCNQAVEGAENTQGVTYHLARPGQ